jgi:hypothetical protein
MLFILNIHFKIVNMKILFLFFGLALIVLQTDKITLKGKVVDGEGNGISGAIVLEVGSANGITTSEDGSFSITVKRGAKISFSFVGFSSSTVDIKEKDVKGMEIIENLIIDLEAGSLLFCCTNHPNSHCANSTSKMARLSAIHSCVF